MHTSLHTPDLTFSLSYDLTLTELTLTPLKPELQASSPLYSNTLPCLHNTPLPDLYNLSGAASFPMFNNIAMYVSEIAAVTHRQELIYSVLYHLPSYTL